jgi:hypothetical protein
VLRLRAQDGRLQADIEHRVVEWDGLDGRHYRATIALKKLKAK